MTWFEVKEEQNKPTAVKAPLKKSNPTYEPKMPPESIFPLERL